MSDSTQYSGQTQAAPEDDPTRSPRFIASTLLEEQPLTQRRHIDADLHWIGESLPIPSDIQVQSAGNGFNTAGKLPFPARVDHTHDTSTFQGVFSSGNKSFPPGSIYFDNIVHTGWGRNMLATSQIIAMPAPGLWHIECNIFVSRDGGGAFQNEVNLSFTYNNGTYSREVQRMSTFDIPNNLTLTAVDTVAYDPAPSTNANVQISIQHNDAVSWTANIRNLVVYRVCGPKSF